MKKIIKVPTKHNIKKYINTNPENGLDSNEIVLRQKEFGFNEIKKIKTKNIFYLFMIQLKDLMALLLLFSGIIALILAFYYKFVLGQNEVIIFVQSAIIIGIVFLNSLFGAIQEFRSISSVKELNKLSSQKAKVLRNGIVNIIDSINITIGDIIIVEAGDLIPADAKLISSSFLRCNESNLTGESLPSEKNSNSHSSEFSALADKHDYIFSGCTVTNGRGTAIVYDIGNKTQIGRIANLLKKNNKIKTPLQLKLLKLGKYLGIVGIIITIFSFLFSIFVLEGIINNIKNANFKNIILSIPPSLILSISLATAAIPEGLSTVINIILAIGMKRMSEKNGLIKKLHAVETLGSTAVICSDKTGTLTMNKMKVVRMWTPNSKTELVPKDKLNKYQHKLIKFATLCTDCVIENSVGSNNHSVIGDPTEIAIVELALIKGYDDDEWDRDNKRLLDIPFDSNRKMMTSINKIDGKNIVIVKGAPDILFKNCRDYNLDIAKNINSKWSNKSIRVIGVAYKEFHGEIKKDMDSNFYEKDLRFLGLIGMIDPPRKEVKKAISECISAGIKPVMITGDHINVAKSIGRELGIYKKGDLAITGIDIDKISEKDLKENICKYSIFARVSPENKIRIIKAWQSINQVVAMTGDGVNDAPALQAADVGCAMGVTGTDVSKEAADMILIDDNFATIVASIKSGRGIYENIRRVTKFLLSSNLASILSIVLGMIVFYFVFDPKFLKWGEINLTQNIIKLEQKDINNLNNYFNKGMGFNTTLTTIQILITNIIIDTIPGIALGTQITSDDLMKIRPRSKYESIFDNGLIKDIFISGFITGIVTVFSFILGAYYAISNQEIGMKFYYGTTAAFITLSIGGVLRSLSISSKKSIFFTHIKYNKFIYLACFISLTIVCIVTLIPKISYIFGEGYSHSDIKNIVKNSDPDLFYKLNNGHSWANIYNYLFNKKNENCLMPAQIYLFSFVFTLIPFIYLEIEKFIKYKFFSKKIESKITEFKIIMPPNKKNIFF
ncbi:MAG: cation-translocating P-type ATPase [Mycoplasmoidaceae bacterium]